MFFFHPIFKYLMCPLSSTTFDNAKGIPFSSNFFFLDILIVLTHLFQSKPLFSLYAAVPKIYGGSQ